ncbi:MAG: 3-dehydroquinate synthase II family protein [Desulfovibrio sp.]|nr:3-dehydroquinate synthase II family protein [Desulfovibrio sp.]MDD7478037.1 3-dehydroquinate synthase II family protein [Desulfovibrio sp.]MDY5486394.1 3-dehydroquinate synthase II family protein [Desulfovibrio sp.]
MPTIFFKSVPYDKNLVTLALESGVDGIIVPDEHVAEVSGLARCTVIPDSEVASVALNGKEDEEAFLARVQKGEKCVLKRGWQVIPVENLLAQSDRIYAEAGTPDEARLAAGILQRGVTGIVVLPEAAMELKTIVAECKLSLEHEDLVAATITRIVPAGLGNRVCCDTISLLHTGQGMLVGNSAAFTFLVHAETEHNDYVASRPFRVNASAVHAYIRLPHDRTCYLGELKAGDPVLVVDSEGKTLLTTIGRVKVEVRPMLLVEAVLHTDEGDKTGAVFLQNAETIRLTAPGGRPVSVVDLRPGDQVLCRIDEAGRHFGMRIKEDIKEA